MESKEIIEIILGRNIGKNRKSCLKLVLDGARYNTGRNMETGEANNSQMRCNIFMRDIDSSQFEDSIMLSGLIDYLILLDLIGSIFKVKNKIDEQKTEIGRALESFSSADPGTIDAIHELRNTLAHRFALATEGKPKGRKFTVYYKDNEFPIVNEKKWQGNYSDKSEDTSTKVYLPSLCDMIEEVVVRLNSKSDNNELELRMTDHDKILSMFTVLS